MENQPIEQTTIEVPQQTSAPTSGQTTEQSSSAKIWYIIGAVVIVAFALWYVYSTQTPSVNTAPTATTQTPTSGQAPASPSTSGNTTADISADLNQPDSSSALDADADASASALQGL